MIDMKVFLTNPPWLDKPGFYGVRAGSRWPHYQPNGAKYMPFPFFLAYAASVLERAGVDVFLYDAVAERVSNEKFMLVVEAHKPDMIVIETSTPSIDVDLDWARKLKAQHPKTIIVFCGTHADMFNDAWLAEHLDVDYVIRGEYEFALLDLIRDIEKTSDVCVNGYLSPLDNFPWPARLFLPMQNYGGDSVGNWMPKPFATMWASRGCPFGCSFCVWPQLMYGGCNYRTRDPKDVVDEMEHLVNYRGFKSIFFDDDTFNVSREHVLGICDELTKRGNIPFSAMCRADCMDEQMLSALRLAGLCGVKYGVESGSQDILDRCGKGLNLAKLREIVPLTKKYKIKTHLTFTFGLPGETQETAQQTIDLMLELNPDSVQMGLVAPWPGTRLYEEGMAAHHLISMKNRDLANVRDAAMTTDALNKEELEGILSRAGRIWHGKKR